MAEAALDAITVGLVSLGCAKNTVDSELMLGMLSARGYIVTNDPAEAEVIIVNTCTFIEDATRESIETILEMSRYKQNGRCRALILAGCMATRYSTQLQQELPEVDAIIGTGELPSIVEAVEKALAGETYLAASSSPAFIYDETAARLLTTNHNLAYVKIAEGCDHRCAYCIIPSIRGKYRSRSIGSITEEVRQLVVAGRKEIVLLAQDTTRYGLDIYGNRSLAQLLEALVQVEGLKWLRFLYGHPDGITTQLLQVMAAYPQICKYIDIPLQHASANVLRRMGRGGDAKQLLELVDRVRQVIPDVTLRTTFIVGYPGESDEDFAQLCSFIEQAEFNHVGIFTYSKEEGTPAALLAGQVSGKVKQKRRQVAMELQRRISRRHNERLVGTCQEVVVETATNDGGWVARCTSQAPEVDGVTYVYGAQLHPGDFIQARIVQAQDYDLIGEQA